MFIVGEVVPVPCSTGEPKSRLPSSSARGYIRSLTWSAPAATILPVPPVGTTKTALLIERILPLALFSVVVVAVLRVEVESVFAWSSVH
jgi:hypothetical protein